jgi:hypothetical protein
MCDSILKMVMRETLYHIRDLVVGEGERSKTRWGLVRFRHEPRSGEYPGTPHFEIS